MSEPSAGKPLPRTARELKMLQRFMRRWRFQGATSKTDLGLTLEQKRMKHARSAVQNLRPRRASISFLDLKAHGRRQAKSWPANFR